MTKNCKNYLKLIAFLMAFFFSASIFASEKNVLDKRFKEYWSSFSKGQFNSASRFIYAKDMELVRAEFVPIFLNAAKSSNPNVRRQADIFFEGIPTELRSTLSAKDSFIGINRLGFAPTPELLTLMKGSIVSINKIQFLSSDEAIIHYTATLSNGYKGDDQERFIKTDGVWQLRLKEIIENASKMRMALEK